MNFEISFAPKILIYRQFLREKDFLTSSIFELTRTLIFWSGYPVEIFSDLSWVEQSGWKMGVGKFYVLKFSVGKIFWNWKVSLNSYHMFYAKLSNFSWLFQLIWKHPNYGHCPSIEFFDFGSNVLTSNRVFKPISFQLLLLPTFFSNYI